MKEEQKTEEILKETDKTTTIEEELLKMKEELKEKDNKNLRLLAEMENLRKRMQKEKSESIAFAIDSTIGEFLSIVDSFENALNFAQNSSDEVKNWAIGFQMILNQLKEVLHNHGIVTYHTLGNRFDPNYHDAIEIIESDDHEDSTIIKELVKGYKSTDRVIRHARVVVCKNKIEVLKEDENEAVKAQEKN
ncbi:MAG: nucleotide exchange factor GrpE [Chlamydiae bacterium RIFCSPHIGHO2_12_FULL_27_8]|nr:MAG: nucleotide exchange factor GrpE [Chlamydiae bacterium RIFCSPHIGHO2_12_FULL_27_8]OGN66501.1 MAG: nucleotide exchange factor GrpE [Chlamydiae bacterium RIFCSPLOWO2_01_FULL_28_7]